MALTLLQPAPLLTVAIPTYNRASFLDAQIGWFVEAVRGHEDACELLVSDNHSTDDTARVIDLWQRRLAGGPVRLRVHRNETNVGAIRNITDCMRKAEGAYVWVAGDDDRICPTALTRVLELLRRQEGLSLVVLNFSSREDGGRLRFERCFDLEHDLITPYGQAAFERFLDHPSPSRWGGLALTTALVYRTRTARAALLAWPEGTGNLLFQLFITAYCAQRGKVAVTRDALLEMRAGVHFFSHDAALYLRFRLGDVPEGFVRMAQLGISRRLCLERIHGVRDEISPQRLAFAFARRPARTLHALARYAGALARLSLPAPVPHSRPGTSLS